MALEDAIYVVSNWAATQRLIKRVYFFGSRVRSEHFEDSDLDIAIELIYPDCDCALAHWMFESNGWQKQLESLLPWPLDIQLFNKNSTPTIFSGLAQSSVLVYQLPIFSVKVG